MASVWVARLRGKRGFEKLVAIKTILPKFAEDPRFERMFLDEAGLSARIEHGNVAQVLDLGEEHDVLYLAMELVDGDSLAKLLRVVQKKKLEIPTGILLRLLADTCGGLHAAHELRGKEGELLGVVHRDVSPQNILVSMHGVAKLIDFGIAKARDRVAEDTTDGMIKGKIHYMAPEQAVGKPVDRRADVWAVGAILYFFLAGRPVYEGDNQVATLHLLSSGRPPLPLPPSVPPPVSAVVRRALAHDPEKRFQTAAEMQIAIEAAMVEARLVTTTSTVGAFVQEHMAERAKRRKEGLDLALSAAAQRAKIAGMLERAGTTSATGQVGITDPGRISEISSVNATYDTVLKGSPSPGELERDTQGALRPVGDRTARHSDTPVPASSQVSATRSAMASPVPETLPRRHTVVSVLVAATLLGAALMAGLALGRHGRAPMTAATAPPPSPIAAPVATVTAAPLAMAPPTGTASPAEAPDAASSESTNTKTASPRSTTRRSPPPAPKAAPAKTPAPGAAAPQPHSEDYGF